MKKVFVLIFTVTIFLIGCGNKNINENFPNYPADDSSDGVIPQEIGKQLAEEMLGGLDIEYAEEESGDVVSWPKQIPNDVPVFEYGKIDTTMVSSPEDGGGIVVQLREVEEDAYAKYMEDLKNSGWEIVNNPKFHNQNIEAEKGDASISIEVDPLDKNTAFVIYMATQ